MSAMDYAVQARAPRGRAALVVMALAGLVFVGSAAIKPSQALPTDPVAAAVDPVIAAVETAPAESAPADIATAAVAGVSAAAEEASAIDWAMIGSVLTFVFTGIGAVAGVVFGWRNDRRKERLADLRARELELEIERLRAIGGC
ncbi:MAG TPA: hypothetical protein VEA44_01185 [Caulobacter sp.]|nr:hypothetical protein [Caulobacter sp.]